MPNYQTCAYHPNLPILNFCRTPQCLMPLCPKCVKAHSSEHATSGTHGNFDNL